jgi:uncharacterized protein YecT (DUF1311 family)
LSDASVPAILTAMFVRSGVCARGIVPKVTALLLLWVQAGAVPAQAPAPRRIDPERFPAYPGDTADAQRHGPERRAPDSDHPHGSCEPSVPRSQWLRCLRETGTILDAKIDEKVASIAEQIESRPGINPARARHWRAALERAQEKWREFRNYECSQVASSERGVAVDGYEAQLLCTLRTGLARLNDLARRYPPE